MGRRSNFARVPKDKYMTWDPRPVVALQPHLPANVRYVEPCAGKGDLIESMRWHGHQCVYACDTHPGRKWIEKRDARDLDKRWCRSSNAQMFVTNPPWTREILHQLIECLPQLLPTWMLIDASWAHTGQAVQYLEKCKHIVSVGRVRWIKGTANDGVDDSAWYLFEASHQGGPRFTGLGC